MSGRTNSIYRLKAYKAAAYLRKLPCHYCGKEPAGTIDHVIPVSQGGTNHPDNLVPACAACNYSKGSRLASRRYKTKRRNIKRSDNPQWL